MFLQLKFAVILFGLVQLLRFAAWRYPHFKSRLKERNLTAQIKARDEGIGRWIEICAKLTADIFPFLMLYPEV